MECGGCTLCCKVCVVPELHKPAGTKCRYQGEGGCTNYENRPESCRKFECAYYQAGGNIELRPDHCGVVWERTGDTMYGTLDRDRDDHPHLAGQINAFKKAGAKVEITNGSRGI